MLECPFTVVSCSWPRPFLSQEEPEPEWEAPLLPTQPRFFLEPRQQRWFWTLLWNDFFRGNLHAKNMRGRHVTEQVEAGAQRGFQVVFRLQINQAGTLLVHDAQYCAIRRNSLLVHTPTTATSSPDLLVPVQSGEVLEIAHWPPGGRWLWSAYLCPTDTSDPATAWPDPDSLLFPYLPHILKRLQSPTGPPLKFFTGGNEPLRTIVSLYSLILNGYVPSSIVLFGDYQWTHSTRNLFARLLPFTQTVSLDDLYAYAPSELLDMAVKHWFVMKAVVSMLAPPYKFGIMDDDIFILDHLDDALSAFRSHAFVFSTNYDHSNDYIPTWHHVYPDITAPLSTGTINGGLFWLHNQFAPPILAQRMLQVSPVTVPQDWEQGFLAMTLASVSSYPLSSQRYYIPALDGFPGGLLGYDYAHNPCGFAAIHFAGSDKPTEGQVLALLPQILAPLLADSVI